jgi:hypothetical protein
VRRGRNFMAEKQAKTEKTAGLSEGVPNYHGNRE